MFTASWDTAVPIFENKGKNKPFRIVQDDGCLVVLLPRGNDKWYPTAWIFQEALEALKDILNGANPKQSLVQKDCPVGG